MGEQKLDEAEKVMNALESAADEIASQVGYENPAFFRRLFKRSTGLTPGAYRRMFKPIVEFAEDTASA